MTRESLHGKGDGKWYDFDGILRVIEPRVLRDEVRALGETYWTAIGGEEKLPWDTLDSMALMRSDEAMYAILRHLESLGRLVPHGGEAITSEEISDLRKCLGLKGGRDVPASTSAGIRMRARFEYDRDAGPWDSAEDIPVTVTTVVDREGRTWKYSPGADEWVYQTEFSPTYWVHGYPEDVFGPFSLTTPKPSATRSPLADIAEWVRNTSAPEPLPEPDEEETKAEVWEEGFEAGYDHAGCEHTPSGISIDPPLNPYDERNARYTSAPVTPVPAETAEEKEDEPTMPIITELAKAMLNGLYSRESAWDEFPEDHLSFERRAVNAIEFLTATGRLVPDGGKVFTAEEVDDVRVLTEGAYINSKYPNQVKRVLTKLYGYTFPENTPAEEVETKTLVGTPSDETHVYDEAVSLSYWLAKELGEHVDDASDRNETLTDTVQRLIETLRPERDTSTTPTSAETGPETETEWAIEFPGGICNISFDPNDPEEMLQWVRDGKLIRREVVTGPWTDAAPTAAEPIGGPNVKTDRWGEPEYVGEELPIQGRRGTEPELTDELWETLGQVVEDWTKNGLASELYPDQVNPLIVRGFLAPSTPTWKKFAPTIAGRKAYKDRIATATPPAEVAEEETKTDGPRKFRKKGDREVEAIQWTGDNPYAVRDFTGTHEPDPERGGNHYVFTTQSGHGELYVAANKAWLDLEIGEWVIKDSLGFYPCKAEIFALSYELVDTEDKPKYTPLLTPSDIRKANPGKHQTYVYGQQSADGTACVGCGWETHQVLSPADAVAEHDASWGWVHDHAEWVPEGSACPCGNFPEKLE